MTGVQTCALPIYASNDWKVLGFSSANNHSNALAFEVPQIGAQLPDVQVHDQVYGRVLIAQPNSPDLTSNQNKVFQTWNDLEVLSAIPSIVQATQEQFVPQMINFESVSGVDFKKGCYPGQEIVARSQYRGVIKRRLSLAHVSIDQLNGSSFNPGVEIFHGDDATSHIHVCHHISTEDIPIPV